MHTEKQRIFDEYAKSQGYADWEALQMDYESNLRPFEEFKNSMFSACDLVQQEQQKRISDNQVKTLYKFYDGGKAGLPECIIEAENHETAFNIAYESYGPQVESWLCQMMTENEKILNPENLIK